MTCLCVLCVCVPPVRSAIAAAEDVGLCKRLVSQLPRVNRNVFVYLTAFLREVLAHADNNKLTAQDLGTPPLPRVFL